MIKQISASQFVSTIGVGTHIPYTDGLYSQISQVIVDLRYIGVTNVRDGLSNGEYGSAPLGSYIQLAKSGIRFTVVGSNGSVNTDATLAATITEVQQLLQAVPGSVKAVEGPNEINNFPITWDGGAVTDGTSELNAGLAMQRALYAAVHDNPALNGVAVDEFTGYNAGGVPPAPDVGTTAGLADFATQHPYPNYGQAPGYWVSPAQATPNDTAPVVYTETGYSTNGGTGNGVDADVQARYTLDLLFDDARNGVTSTYLYQLLDAYAPGSRQGDDGFGLFDPTGAPKPVAVALHNLTTILADSGAAPSAQAASGYTVAGLPATGNSLLVGKSNGASDIAVWAEPQIWNQAAGAEITAPATPITVLFGASYATVLIFDPLLGATPVSILNSVSQVSLSLTDHPLIVEVQPGLALPTQKPFVASPTLSVAQNAGPTPIGIGPPTDVNYASGLVVAVASLPNDGRVALADGTVVIAGQGLSAAQLAGLVFTPASGAAGRSSSLSYTVTDPAGNSSTGTALLTVTAAVGSAAVLGAGPDSLVLSLSENAYQGDALALVTVDGAAVGTAPARATHGAGETLVSVAGQFATGAHTVDVTFENDLYGGTATTDRNLYLDGASLNGAALPVAAQPLYNTGSIGVVTFGAAAPPPPSVPSVPPTPVLPATPVQVVGSGPDTLTLSVSEDAYKGDAIAAISVDGTLLGYAAAWAARGMGDTQINVRGAFASGPHSVSVVFANDAYGGTATTDRNFYVDGVKLNGSTLSTATQALYSSGTAAIVGFGGASGAAASIAFQTVPTAAPAGSPVLAPGVTTQLANGAQVVVASDRDTVTAGIGDDTIYAAGGATTAGVAGGRLTFIGGSLGSTVSGGAGVIAAYGGTGGGSFTAGTTGQSLLVAGGGQTVLKGIADGDELVGGSTGLTLMQAGAGAETLIGGLGSAALRGGVAGSTAMFAGHGADSFGFGSGKNAAVVSGFKVGVDAVDIGSEAGRAMSSAIVGSATVLTLSDGTSLAVLGVHLAASDFK